MDASRFDSLSRLVGRGLSRRSSLRLVLAALVGGASLGVDEAVAATRMCRDGGRQCTRHGQCCTGNCMRLTTSRRPRFVCGCEQGRQLCNSTRCVDLDTDERNCGACGKRCKAGESCCDGRCVMTGTPAACSGCGDVCRPGETCIEGECTSGCGCDAGEVCDDGGICCDCTGKCGAACDGNCPPCPSGKVCGASDTCEDVGICAVASGGTYVSIDATPITYSVTTYNVYPPNYSEPDNVASATYTPCTASTDCSACPTSIAKFGGGRLDVEGCICLKAWCQSNVDTEPLLLDGAWYALPGQAGTYYCTPMVVKTK